MKVQLFTERKVGLKKRDIYEKNQLVDQHQQINPSITYIALHFQ